MSSQGRPQGPREWSKGIRVTAAVTTGERQGDGVMGDGGWDDGEAGWRDGGVRAGWGQVARSSWAPSRMENQ